MNRKDSDLDLSTLAEVKPLVAKYNDNTNVLKVERQLNGKEIAAYGFYIAPIWFITEVRVISLFCFVVKKHKSCCTTDICGYFFCPSRKEKEKTLDYLS